MPSNNQNDYKLLYLYYLADNEGKLKEEYWSEYERLKLLYSIDRAKSESKDYLEELGYVEYTGEGNLEHGEWIVTKEADKEAPYVVTQKGLDILGNEAFESETSVRSLQREILYLQKENLKYEKKIRAWRIIAAIGTTIGTIVGMFLS